MTNLIVTYGIPLKKKSRLNLFNAVAVYIRECGSTLYLGLFTSYP